jgi:hypothetical protein
MCPGAVRCALAHTVLSPQQSRDKGPGPPEFHNVTSSSSRIRQNVERHHPRLTSVNRQCKSISSFGVAKVNFLSEHTLSCIDSDNVEE